MVEATAEHLSLLVSKQQKLNDIMWGVIETQALEIEELKNRSKQVMARKGSCGGSPRVGKKGDSKPSGNGRGRGRNSRRK